MQLLQSWRSSLAVFKPSNFKLFFLITAKTVLETIKTWTKHWWWLIVLYVATITLFYVVGWHVVLPQASASSSEIMPFLVTKILDYISYSVWLAIIWTLLLTIRPSVEQKTYRYYHAYWRHGVGLLFVLMLINLFFAKGSHHYVSLLYERMQLGEISIMGRSLYYAMSYLVTPLLPIGVYIIPIDSVIFSALFILFAIMTLDARAPSQDSGNIMLTMHEGIVRRRVWRMFLYTLPFIYIVSLVSSFVLSFLSFGHGVLVEWTISLITTLPFIPMIIVHCMVSGVTVLLWILFASIMCNLYTKQIHEHFNRYF